MISHEGQSGPKALRSLLDHEPIVRCLGAHDVLTAKLIEQAGLECLFVGGFGVSASLLGLPDMNLVHLPMMADAAKRTINAVSIPVIIDGDTGHGDLHNVQQTVELFEQVGAAGILIEDQAFPKRCGHFDGKRVIPLEEMVLKIHAALDARRDPDLVLIARTDALACEGLSSAIERGQAYAEAGADVVYVEAPENDATLVTLPSAIARPLAVNMLTGGRTPTHSLQEMCEFGYKLAIWPIESLLVSARIVQKLVKTLLESGRIDNMKPEMITFKEIQNLLGLPSILELRSRMEERAGHKRVS